jgi:hypothetical protein
MKLHKEVKQLKQKFASFTITHIPRNENEEADRLTHVAREREANGSQKWEPLGQGRWLDLPMRVRASTHAADSEPAPPPRGREGTAVILANNTPPSPPMGSKEAAVAVVQAVVIGGAAVAGELITVLAKPHTMRRRTSYRVYREG